MKLDLPERGEDRGRDRDLRLCPPSVKRPHRLFRMRLGAPGDPDSTPDQGQARGPGAEDLAGHSGEHRSELPRRTRQEQHGPVHVVEPQPGRSPVRVVEDPSPSRNHRLAPIDRQEVWAAGVTYKRSQVARMEESESAATHYDKVYTADRPELFLKATPHRVSGPGDPVRVRADSN